MKEILPRSCGMRVHLAYAKRGAINIEKMKKGRGPESKLVKMMDQFAKGEVPSATKAFVKICDDDEFALNVLCTCSSSIDVTFLVLTQNPKMLKHAYYHR